MRIGVVSDLHLEYSACTVQAAGLDVLVLAGDIHSSIPALAAFLTAHRALHLVVVAGNHEYYGKYMHQTREQMACLAGPRCHVLDNSAVTLRGVCFVGGTLWAAVPPAEQPLVQLFIGDFGAIPEFGFEVAEAAGPGFGR